MGLLADSAALARQMLEDTALFAQPVTVTDPDGLTATVTANTRDIPKSIDPETGALVKSRTVGVAFSMATLTAAGFTSFPKGEAKESRRKWVVRFSDAAGVQHVFAVREANPDGTLGVVTCELEAIRGTADP